MAYNRRNADQSSLGLSLLLVDTAGLSKLITHNLLKCFRQHELFNPRSLEVGGGGQIDPTPSIFLALNFCSLTDCQKL